MVKITGDIFRDSGTAAAVKRFGRSIKSKTVIPVYLHRIATKQRLINIGDFSMDIRGSNILERRVLTSVIRPS